MNYTDEQNARINNVYNQREKALAENQSVYSGLLDDAGSLREQQNSFLAQQEQTQNEMLNKQLENQTNLINQQKQEAQENANTERKQALNSYNAYINPYGYQAESLASNGLSNSGLSETSQLGAYVTYQNRVAQANSTLQKAITEYDNSINDAILNNDVQKAQNALTRLQAELEANENYYNTRSSLTQSMLNTQLSINSEYNNQYNSVYNQILNEQKQAEAIRQYNQDYELQQQKLAESIRQYNEQLAYQRERDAIADAQWQKEYELSKKKISSSSSGSSSNKSKNNYTLTDNSKSEPILETNISLNPDQFSSKSASNWYQSNIMNKSFSESSFTALLDKAVKDKKIKQADATKIANTYYYKK